MNKDLLNVLLQDAVIPELMSFIRAHFLHSGTLPTDEEAIAHLQQHAQAVIATGEAWLAQHGSQ